jgi:hypothetical protein
MAFPTTGIIDNFNRTDEDPLSDGGKWSLGPDDFGSNTMRVFTNEARHSAGLNPVNAYRNDQDYGPNTEVYLTLVVLPATAVLLYLRCVNIGAGTTDGYATYYNFSGTDDFLICRNDNDALTGLGASVAPGNWSAGDGLGLEMIGSTIAVYDRRSGVWAQQATRTDSTYTAAGTIGFKLNDTGTNTRVDDFGGGTVVAAGRSPIPRRQPLHLLAR